MEIVTSEKYEKMYMNFHLLVNIMFLLFEVHKMLHME
jgi:hypothetical protein